MKPRLFVEEAARADLADAFGWYEGQQAGLGSEFLAAVAVVFEWIEENPTAYPIIRGATRRVLLRRFPYSVFYVVDPDLGRHGGHARPTRSAAMARAALTPNQRLKLAGAAIQFHL